MRGPQHGGDAEELRHKTEVLRRHCDDVGRDPRETLISASVGLHDGVPAALRTSALMEAAGARRVILGPPYLMTGESSASW